MESIYPLWMEIVDAAERGEWLGWDADEGYRFARRTMSDFDPLVPASTIRNLLANHGLGTYKSAHLLISDSEHVPYLYRDPRIDVIIVDNHKILGPLTTDGVRREVNIETPNES